MVLPLLSLITFIGYLYNNRRPYKYTFKTKLDSKIRLIPIFLIPYATLFPYIAFSYLYLKGPALNTFAVSIIISNILANLFWYFVPNGVKREKLHATGYLSKLLNFLYTHDQDANGFPSGHVYLSLICAYFLGLNSHTGLHYTIGALIAISTIFTKQHYVVDIVGGFLWAVVSIFAAKLLLGY
jgi:membrane-associated phospholipid phosphatase